MSMLFRLSYRLLPVVLTWNALVAVCYGANDQTQPLTADEALRSIRLRDGFRARLAAAEPLVQDPVAIDWDVQGRLWVAEMADYPLGIDGRGRPGGRVRILEDSDRDGIYDKSTLFLDGLRFPNGILTWRGGVLITAAPEIIYAEDSDGDGRADTQRVLFTGFNAGNQQLRVNGLRWGLDNWVYCASGSHHAGYGATTGITVTSTGERVTLGSRDFRIRPDAGLIDAQSGPAQFGRNRDDWGNWFGVQNSYPLWHYVLEDHYLRRNSFFVPPSPRHNLTEPNPRLFPIKQPQKRFHSFEHSTRFTSACSGMIYRDTLLFRDVEVPDSVQHSFTCAPFHSLVQHNWVHEDGTTFRLTRDPNEESQEFFASTDRWCRPVMVRTGPDGALWVVDMYRYMIEHPEWVNEAARKELRPFYRHGEAQGRIYRIVPNKGSPGTVPQLNELATEQLIGMLGHSNGWLRDKAQQLLLWRNQPTCIAPLRQMALNGPSALARLHALCTLDGLDAVDESVLRPLLADPSPGVRRHAIRLAERFSVLADPTIERLRALATDEDAKVRLQLACSLGNLDARCRPLLAQLLTESNDRYMTAAAMSSVLADDLPEILNAVLANPVLKSEVVESLIRQSLATDVSRSGDVARLLAHSSRPIRWRLEVLSALLTVVSLDELNVDSPTKRSISQLLEAARQTALDEGASIGDRSTAISLLFRRPGEEEPTAPIQQLLSPHVPPTLQAALVRRAAELAKPTVAAELLSRWQVLSPNIKEQMANAMLARSTWTEVLLSQLEKKTIPTVEISASIRQQLLRRHDDKLSARAEHVFGNPSNVPLAQVIAHYRSALSLERDKIAGKQVFSEKCAGCHRLGGIGKDIGPRLVALTDKSDEALLVAILDPSRAVEAKYLSYVVATADGRSNSGMITTETAAGITLVKPDGQAVSILRSEIEYLQSTQKSLMPDGLQTNMSQAEFVNLIGFIQQSQD